MVCSTALVSVIQVDNKLHVYLDDAPFTLLLSKAHLTTSCEMFSNSLAMDFSNGEKVDTGTLEIEKQYCITNLIESSSNKVSWQRSTMLAKITVPYRKGQIKRLFGEVNIINRHIVTLLVKTVDRNLCT